MPRLYPEKQRDLIVLQLTGQLFFLGLFVLSLFYWKERQAFDAAHYLIEIINRKFFFMAHGRPVGIFTQVLPVIATWLRLPLKAVAILYSVGDILWYYVLFLWLAYGLKTRQGIISLLLLLSLTVRYSFFCPVTELLQGIALLPVWLNLLSRSFRFRIFILLLLLALILFSHPLLFYPVLFSLAWWQSDTPEKGKLPRILWPAFAVLTALKFFFLDAYDHGKTFYPVVYNDYGYLKTLSFSAFTDLAAVIAGNYTLLTLLFTVLILFLLLQGRRRQALLLFLSITGYLVLITATHRFGGISNYSERMLLPLPAMIALATPGILLRTKLFIIRISSWIFLLLVLLLHIDLLRITARPYTLRVRQIQALTDVSRQLGIKKGIVKEELMEQTSFAMTGWSYSMESLLLSSYEGPDASVSIVMQRDHIDRIQEQVNTLKDDQWVMWAERLPALDVLHKNYFRLPATPYRALYGTAALYTDTVSLSLMDAEKINAHTTALVFQIKIPPGKIFYSNDSNRLQIQLPGGPELRMLLPCHLTGNSRLITEIPASHLPEEAPIQAALVSGPLTAGKTTILHRSGRFWEEK